MAVRVAVTADDLGYSAARDAGLIACAAARGGLVTRASLLVNGATGAAALRAALDAGLAVGLHLNLTEGRPVATPLSAVASLLDGDAGDAPAQFMRGKHGLRAAIAAGRVRADELAAEASAQLDRFVALHPRGEIPAHVDGHQHVHVIPFVAAAVLPVFARRGVLRTRIPALLPRAADVEAAGEASLFALLNDPHGDRRDFYAHVSAEAEAARSLYVGGGRGGFTASRFFVGFTTMGAECSEARARAALGRALDAAASSASEPALEGAPAPDVEWMVHPGQATRATDAGAAGCGQGPDDFAASDGREAEMRLLAPQRAIGSDGEAVQACALRRWLESERGVALVQ